MDVAEAVDAERRNELINGVPETLGHGRIGFAPVAADRVDVAGLGVEVDDVGRHATFGQQVVGAVKVEVAVRFADRVALAF